MTAATPQATESNRHFPFYAAGFLAMTILPMTNLLVPLWAIAIGASPFMIGLAIGARSLLPVLFSIHGGALMDRLGTRRVMIISVTVALVMAPLYPLLPFIWALIAIQVVGGFAQSLGWIGAQTQMAQVTGGDRRLMGRFTFTATIGNSVGPLLAGVAWDILGPWGGFGLLTIWTASFTLCIAVTPAVKLSADSGRTGRGMRDILPRGRDYADAFGMWLIPMIATIMTASMLMAGVHSMRGSFYPVYLTDIGMSKTLIGVLVTTGTLTSAVAGLFVGHVSRFISPIWVMIISLIGATFAIAVTPMTGQLPVLFALAVAFGLMAGTGFPLILSELARTADVSQQGMSVGLRTTLNRLVAMTAPIALGAIAEAADILTAFFVIAGVNVAVTAFLATRLRRLRHRPRQKE